MVTMASGRPDTDRGRDYGRDTCTRIASLISKRFRVLDGRSDDLQLGGSHGRRPGFRPIYRDAQHAGTQSHKDGRPLRTD